MGRVVGRIEPGIRVGVSLRPAAQPPRWGSFVLDWACGLAMGAGCAWVAWAMFKAWVG